MNLVDRAILALAPGWGLRRARARVQASAMHSAYDAAERNRLRRTARDFGSGTSATMMSAAQIRTQARHLDRNHDIAIGGLNVLVQNIVGPAGIGVEPQPRDENGDIVEELVDQIVPLYRDWSRRPEVTWRHDRPSMERLLARTMFRDGEVLFQDLVGPVAYLEHGTSIPYSIEMIEPDLLPLDLFDQQRNIMQGVECNAWGRPVAYWLYKQHPGDPFVAMPETKRVPADLIHHATIIERIGQRRGVSLLASVLTRLDDLKDYEESERIAAKIAACMAAVIVKGDPGTYNGGVDAEGNPLPARHMQMQPGMIFDNLRPGESVSTIDTKRPNAGLEPYRNGQLRAVASGMRVSFSSLSKNYNGTYSSQRQELVEQYGAYGVLAYEVISQISRPMYERAIFAAVASGKIKIPRRKVPVNIDAIADALHLPPQMPWIDPEREANAMATMEEHAYMSGPEIIRRRGANPRDVLDQQAAWLARKREWGIPNASAGSQAAPTAPAAQVPADPTELETEA